MQHVADGIMHAYLDGALDAIADAGELPAGVTGADVRAHFAACADCRARLDDARAVKERAGLILDDAGRDVVDVPPFALISGRSQPRRRMAWLPMAWAASVVLAIGAGWWASDIARNDRVTVAGDLAAPAMSTPAASDVGRQEGVASEPLPDPDAATDAPVTDGRETDGRVTDTPVMNAPVTGATVAEAAPTTPAPTTPAPTTPAMAASSMADLAVAPLAGGASGSAVGRAASGVGADAAGAQITQVERAEVESAKAGIASEEVAGHPDPGAFRAQLAAARADTTAWRRIDGPSTGAVGAQRAVRVVAGAGAAVYDATAPTIGLGELVRARQWLDTGEQIEVITARPQRLELSGIIVTGAADPEARRMAAPPSAARRLAAPSREAAESGAAADGGARVAVVSSERLGDGRAEVTVWLRDEGIWVSMRGALPPAELAALAHRLVRPDR